MDPNDDATRLVLEDDTYALVRRRYGVSTWVPIPRKIRWCGGALLVAAALLPIIVLLPAPVRETYVGQPASQVSLDITLVHLLGVFCVTLASIGLAGVALRASNIADLTEEQAWKLAGIETIFTAFIAVIGVLAIVATLALVAVGHGGVDTVETFVDRGIDPYRASGSAAVPVWISSLVAFVCGLGVLGLSVAVKRTTR